MPYYVKKDQFYLRVDISNGRVHSMLTSDKESASAFRLGAAQLYSGFINGKVMAHIYSGYHNEKLRASKNHVELYFSYLSDIRESF